MYFGVFFNVGISLLSQNTTPANCPTLIPLQYCPQHPKVGGGGGLESSKRGRWGEVVQGRSGEKVFKKGK